MNENISFTKKTKRIIALALVLVLCLVMVPIGTMATVPTGNVNDWDYELEYSDGPSGTSGEVTIDKDISDLRLDSDGNIIATITLTVTDNPTSNSYVVGGQFGLIFSNGNPVQNQDKILVMYDYDEYSESEIITLCKEKGYACHFKLYINFGSESDSYWVWAVGNYSLSSNTNGNGSVINVITLDKPSNDDRFTYSYYTNGDYYVANIPAKFKIQMIVEYGGYEAISVEDLIDTDYYKLISGSASAGEDDTVTETTNKITWKIDNTGNGGPYVLTYDVILLATENGEYLTPAATLFYDDKEMDEEDKELDSPRPGYTLDIPTVTLTYAWAGTEQPDLDPPDPKTYDIHSDAELYTLSELADYYSNLISYDNNAITYIDSYNNKWTLTSAWYDDSCVGSSNIIGSQIYDLEDDTTVYAKWTKSLPWTVTYSVTGIAPLLVEQDDWPYSIPDPETYYESDTVTVKSVLTPASDTYNGVKGTWTFSGWEYSGETYGLDDTFTMPNSNVVLTGSWSFVANDYDISYVWDYSGWEGDFESIVNPSYASAPSIPAGEKKEAGTSANRAATPSPFTGTLDGVHGSFEFDGYDVTCDESFTINNDGSFTMPSADVVFDGVWTFTPISSAFTVSKTFVGLGAGDTETEIIADIKNKVPSYQLLITIGTPVARPLTLTDAGVAAVVDGAGNVTFTWTLPGVSVNTTYTLSESGHTATNYDFNEVDFDSNGTYVGIATLNTGVKGSVRVVNNYSAQYQVSYQWENNPFTDADVEVATAPGLPASYYKSAGSTVTVDPTLNVGAKVYGTKNGVYGYWEFSGWTKYGTNLGNTTTTDGTFTMPSHNVVIYGGWSDFTVETTVFIVTKTFKGIEATDVDEASTLISGFVITLTPVIVNGLLDTFTLAPDASDPYLDDVQIDALTGDIVVTWTINGFPVGNDYTVSENGQDAITGYKWLVSDSSIPELVNYEDELAELLNVYEKLYTVTYVVEHNYTGDFDIGSESFPTSIPTSDRIYEAGNTLDFEHELTYENIPGTLDGQVGYFVVSAWEAEPVSAYPDANKEFTMPESDVTFTAVVTFVPMYTVNYVWAEANGDYRPTDAELLTAATNLGLTSALPGTFRQIAGANVDVAYGSVYDGYRYLEIGYQIEGVYDGTQGTWTFLGWATDDAQNVTVARGANDFMMPESDVTLNGIWTFDKVLLVQSVRVTYDGYAHTVIIFPPNDFDDDNEFIMFSTDGSNWMDTNEYVRYIDVRRNADNSIASNPVYVKVVDKDGKETRRVIAIAGTNNAIVTDDGLATVTIDPRYVTITANSATYGYTGALRTVTNYAFTSLRDGPATDSDGNAIASNTLTWITGEQIVSSAYGEGRGVANGTRRYDVIMGRDENGNYPYSGIDAEGKTVYAYILKADGRTDSTGNYMITLADGTLVITGSTNNYTPTTTTTTTTTPATTATVSLADPPAYQTIGDTTTPLAQMPVSDTPIDIADESVPLGPVTGDVSPIVLLICLLMISGVAIVVVGKKRFGKSN